MGPEPSWFMSQTVQYSEFKGETIMYSIVLQNKAYPYKKHSK